MKHDDETEVKSGTDNQMWQETQRQEVTQDTERGDNHKLKVLTLTEEIKLDDE